MAGREHRDAGDHVHLGFSEEQVNGEYVGMGLKYIEHGAIEGSYYEACSFALD